MVVLSYLWFKGSVKINQNTPFYFNFYKNFLPRAGCPPPFQTLPGSAHSALVFRIFGRLGWHLWLDTTDLPGLGDSPASLTHSISFECTSRQSIALQASSQGMANRSTSFQADLLSTLYIDLFPTVRNAQLPVFLSSFPDMSAKGEMRFPTRGIFRECCTRFRQPRCSQRY